MPDALQAIVPVNAVAEASPALAVIQAIGFATSFALCGLVGVMQWRSERESGLSVFYVGLWVTGALWASGSFLQAVLRLSGVPENSPVFLAALLLAWSSTCFGPPLIARIVNREIPGESIVRTIVLSASVVGSVGLLALFVLAVARPGVALPFVTVGILAFFSALAHAVGCAVIFRSRERRDRRTGPRAHWLFPTAMTLLAAWFTATALSIFLPREFGTARMAGAIVSQQWMLLWSVLAAVFLADTRHADVVLKRTLMLIASVIVATLAVWWLPIARGIPLIAASLLGAALLLLAPAMHKAVGRLVDRGVLHRPDYAALARTFADASRLAPGPDELLALAAQAIRAALALEARFVAPGSHDAPKTAALRMDIRGASDVEYVLEVIPSSQGRTLMHEELGFLQSVVRDAGRRLEGLSFERERRGRQLRETILQHSLTEAELRALRSQVDPHFLFNTLNTIVDLIASDPRAAEAMTERLAEFFRYTLTRARHPLTTLEEELSCVRHYLDIERVRFGDRLTVEIACDSTVAQARVPSLILQPLVENAVRHGLAPRLEGGRLSIRADLDGASLHLQVVDDGMGMPSPGGRSAGVGLRNVRERLAALYGQSARLAVGPGADGSGTRVELFLPTHGH
jgi:hypothetical protein